MNKWELKLKSETITITEVREKKKMTISSSNGDFTVEIKGDLTKSTFDSEKHLLEYLEGFKSISDYELEVSEELWAKVINILNK